MQAAGPDQPAIPSEVLAEQGVLGALLLRNDVYAQVGGFLRAEHFFEPFHGKLYAILSDQIAAGRPATPITVVHAMPDVEVAPGLTSRQYVVRLAAEAVSILDARQLAEIVRDTAAMRRIMAAASSMPRHEGWPRDRIAAALDEIDQVRADMTASLQRRSTAGEASLMLLDRIARISAGEVVDVCSPTGWTDLDRMLNGGFYGGDLVVEAGRPGMGKTVVADVLAFEAARQGKGTLVFSLEVDRLQTVARMLAHRTYTWRDPITFGRILAGRDLKQEELWRIEEAHQELERLPLVIDDSSSLSVAELAQRVRVERDRMARQGVTLGLVTVDYLKFLKASNRYTGQRTYEVGEITRGLKQLALDLNVTVLLCAQLNRNVESREDKRPGLADLRESGDLEADADVVAFIYREFHYVENSPKYRDGDQDAMGHAQRVRNDLELIIGKNRRGPIGTVNLFCDVGSSHVSQRLGGSR